MASASLVLVVLLTACATLQPSLCQALGTSPRPFTTPVVAVRGRISGPGSCLLVNCSKKVLECLTDGQCFKASLCNSGCLKKTNVEGCNLLCELTYGYNSSKYRDLLQCMSEHGCLPVSPPDGICLANDTDTIKNLTDMAQVCKYSGTLLLWTPLGCAANNVLISEVSSFQG